MDNDGNKMDEMLDKETLDFIREQKQEKEYKKLTEEFFKDEEKKVLEPFFKEASGSFAMNEEGFKAALKSAQITLKHELALKKAQKEANTQTNENKDKGTVGGTDGNGGEHTSAKGGIKVDTSGNPNGDSKLDITDTESIKTYFKEKGLDEAKIKDVITFGNFNIFK